MGDPVAPQLPPDAPQDVKDFFDCKTDKLVWKKGKVTWLTIKVTDDVEVTPDVSFEHGKAGSVQISINLAAGISGTVGASVNADGQLVINDVSIMLKPFKGKIDEAVKTINDWFKHKGKKLKPAVLKKGDVTLEKTATTGAHAPSIVPLSSDGSGTEHVAMPVDSTTNVSYVAFDSEIPPPPASTAVTAPPTVGAGKTAQGLSLGLLSLLLILTIVIGTATGFLLLGGQGPGPLASSVAQATMPTPTPTPSPTPTPAATPTVTPVVTPTPVLTPTPVPAVTATPGPIGEFTGLCVRVVHEALEDYISYLSLAMYWSGVDVGVFIVTVEGANDGKPVELVYDPESGSWLGDLGLRQAGEKQIVSVEAVLTDGTTVNVTPEFVGEFGMDVINVRHPEQDSYGDRCID